MSGGRAHVEEISPSGTAQEGTPFYAEALKWSAALAVGAGRYGVSQMGGVAYGERELGVVNFRTCRRAESEARSKQPTSRDAVRLRHDLAQCVATDSTCPVRDSSIDRIKTMVKDAAVA